MERPVLARHSRWAYGRVNQPAAVAGLPARTVPAVAGTFGAVGSRDVKVRPHPPGGIAARQVDLTLPSHDLAAELAEQVVVREGPAVPALGREPVQHAQPGQPLQPRCLDAAWPGSSTPPGELGFTDILTHWPRPD